MAKEGDDPAVCFERVVKDAMLFDYERAGERRVLMGMRICEAGSIVKLQSMRRRSICGLFQDRLGALG